jgi:hypothetical protein
MIIELISSNKLVRKYDITHNFFKMYVIGMI